MAFTGSLFLPNYYSILEIPTSTKINLFAGSLRNLYTAYEEHEHGGGKDGTIFSKLGIGVANPLIDLAIGGRDVGFQKSDVSPNAGYLRFGDTTGWKFHIGRARESCGGSINTDLMGVLMTIQDNGNIGIGTNSPTKGKLVIDAGAATALYIANPLDVGSNQGAINIGGGLFLDNNEIQCTTKLYINNENNVDLTINNGGGDVGIGLENPDRRLHIKQSVNTYDGGLALERSDATDEWEIFCDNSNTLGFSINTAIKMYLTSGGNLYVNGNVGINEINPNYTLDVNGNCRITGNLYLPNIPTYDKYDDISKLKKMNLNNIELKDALGYIIGSLKQLNNRIEKLENR